MCWWCLTRRNATRQAEWERLIGGYDHKSVVELLRGPNADLQAVRTALGDWYAVGPDGNYLHPKACKAEALRSPHRHPPHSLARFVLCCVQTN